MTDTLSTEEMIDYLNEIIHTLEVVSSESDVHVMMELAYELHEALVDFE